MKSGNQDKAEGTAKEIKGKIKQGVGKATGNEDTEREGELDEAEGKVQDKVGDVKKVFNR